MKKVFKFSILIVAILLLFINVKMNVNGNKLEGVSMSVNALSAQADPYCFYKISDGKCYCAVWDVNCPFPCPNGNNSQVCME